MGAAARSLARATEVTVRKFFKGLTWAALAWILAEVLISIAFLIWRIGRIRGRF